MVMIHFHFILQTMTKSGCQDWPACLDNGPLEKNGHLAPVTTNVLHTQYLLGVCGDLRCFGFQDSLGHINLTT